MWRRAVALCAAMATAVPAVAWAQQAPADAPEESIDDQVARSLYEQALKLFHAGRFADARELALEAATQSPNGPYAQSARELVNRCDDKLGRPQTFPPVATGGGEGPLNPYGDDGASGGGDGPVNPYGDDGKNGATASGDEPQNPYGDDQNGGAKGGGGGEPLNPYGGDTREDHPHDRRAMRRGFTLLGGIDGAWTGLGLAAGTNAGGGASALLVIGGTVGGAGLGYWLSGRSDLSRAQLNTVAAGSFWGAAYGVMFEAIADDPKQCDGCANGPEDAPSSHYWLSATITSAAGLGAGVWLARQHPSEGDVALVDSLGGYGLVGALELGAAMDPAQGRAYAVNSLVGTTAGLAVGLYLVPRVEVSRRRMAYVDLGAGLGAAAPWVVYGMLGGGGAGAKQWTGVASLAFMGAGGWLAWKWTKHMDDKPEPSAGVSSDELVVAPGLIERDRRGAWRLGVPSIGVVPAVGGGRASAGLELVTGLW